MLSIWWIHPNIGFFEDKTPFRQEYVSWALCQETRDFSENSSHRATVVIVSYLISSTGWHLPPKWSKGALLSLRTTSDVCGCRCARRLSNTISPLRRFDGFAPSMLDAPIFGSTDGLICAPQDLRHSKIEGTHFVTCIATAPRFARFQPPIAIKLRIIWALSMYFWEISWSTSDGIRSSDFNVFNVYVWMFSAF